MSYSSRLFALLCLAACAFAGFAYTCPEYAAAVGLDWRELDQFVAQRKEQVERLQWLELRSQVIQARLNAKFAVVERIVRGEMTLFEAAAWFRHLNETPPEHQDNYRAAFPGRNDEEKACRQVIGWVYNELTGNASPTRADEMRERLEKILADHIAQHGKVILPAL